MVLHLEKNSVNGSTDSSIFLISVPYDLPVSGDAELLVPWEVKNMKFVSKGITAQQVNFSILNREIWWKDCLLC